SPVVVEGRLWGAIVAATGQSEPLPAEIESRIGEFTGLVATTISNAEARGEVLRLAEEQAAPRRLAGLVAQRPSPAEIFNAVAEAVGSVLGADMCSVLAFRDDVAAVVVGSWSCEELYRPPRSLPLDSDGLVPRIFRSGAAARVDTRAPGPVADI